MAIGPTGAAILRNALRRLSGRHGDSVFPFRRPAHALVLEGAVSLLTNPLALRAGLLFFGAMAVFGLSLVLIRQRGKNLVSDPDSLTSASLAAEGLPVHAYHSVIQQLKQQKQELAAQPLS